MLDMALLLQVLEGPTKKIPIPSLVNSFRRVFDESQDISNNLPCKPDVVLDLADRQVFCHSVLLRARSPLFAAFFDDDEWTVKRWSVDGTIVVNLKHLTWRVMEFVVQFMCCGADEEMFENISMSLFTANCNGNSLALNQPRSIRLINCWISCLT
jgi:hypothetical protein